MTSAEWAGRAKRCLALLTLLLLARCGQPTIDCTQTVVTTMPLRAQAGLLTVPIGVNGRRLQFLVDTGAERTTIAEAAADQLHLPRDARFTSVSKGVGGSSSAADAIVDRLVIGDKRFPVERLAVNGFKQGLPADGLLGADLLLGFDMDIDVPGGALTLYRPRICPETRPPWPDKAIEITGVRARRDRLVVPFTLDGLEGTALLDTGATHNVLSLDFARRLGLTDQVLQADPAFSQRGVGPSAVTARLHRFRLLKIGPAIQHNPALTILPGDTGFGDALIGEEFLQGRRIWLSFRNRQVFVSPRGAEQ